MTIRSFIAVTLNREMANELGDVAAQMAYQDKSNAVRWVDQQNYHLTLAFLGDQRERDLEELAEHLDAHLPHNGMPISVSHLSPFPESRPKLIAAMITKTDELNELHHQVVNSVLACGLAFEKRRFVPHITLGRFRHSKNHFVGAIPTSRDISAEVADVSIFESTLTPSGAEYEALFRFPLDFEYELDSFE